MDNYIIAVDFDGTLCEDCWPEIGAPNLKLIGELIYRRSIGDKLILWTCRSDIQLMNAVRWCKSYGLTFDAIKNMMFAAPVVSYGKRIISVITCNGRTVITRHVMKDAKIGK